METRDEQALNMARVICPAVSTEKCVNGTCPKLWDCPVKISIFEKLVDAGYGDISAYKAEIERLTNKSDTNQAGSDILIPSAENDGKYKKDEDKERPKEFTNEILQ